MWLGLAADSAVLIQRQLFGGVDGVALGKVVALGDTPIFLTYIAGERHQRSVTFFRHRNPLLYLLKPYDKLRAFASVYS